MTWTRNSCANRISTSACSPKSCLSQVHRKSPVNTLHYFPIHNFVTLWKYVHSRPLRASYPTSYSLKLFTLPSWEYGSWNRTPSPLIWLPCRIPRPTVGKMSTEHADRYRWQMSCVWFFPLQNEETFSKHQFILMQALPQWNDNFNERRNAEHCRWWDISAFWICPWQLQKNWAGPSFNFSLQGYEFPPFRGTRFPLLVVLNVVGASKIRPVRKSVSSTQLDLIWNVKSEWYSFYFKIIGLYVIAQYIYFLSYLLSSLTIRISPHNNLILLVKFVVNSCDIKLVST